jgi:hypothetical protein
MLPVYSVTYVPGLYRQGRGFDHCSQANARSPIEGKR